MPWHVDFWNLVRVRRHGVCCAGMVRYSGAGVHQCCQTPCVSGIRVQATFIRVSRTCFLSKTCARFVQGGQQEGTAPVLVLSHTTHKQTRARARTHARTRTHKRRAPLGRHARWHIEECVRHRAPCTSPAANRLLLPRVTGLSGGGGGSSERRLCACCAVLLRMISIGLGFGA
jgi:hypothetical protein